MLAGLELIGLWAPRKDEDKYLTFPSEGLLNAYLQAVYRENAVISISVLGLLTKEDIDRSGRVGRRYKSVFTKNSKPSPRIGDILNPSFLYAGTHDSVHALMMSHIPIPSRAFIWLMLDKIRFLSKKHWSAESWRLADFHFSQEIYHTIAHNAWDQQLRAVFFDDTIIPSALSVLAFALVTPQELGKIGMDYLTIIDKVFNKLSTAQYLDLASLIQQGHFCFDKIPICFDKVSKNKLRKNGLVLLVDKPDGKKEKVNLGAWNELTQQVPLLSLFKTPVQSKPDVNALQNQNLERQPPTMFFCGFSGCDKSYNKKYTLNRHKKVCQYQHQQFEKQQSMKCDLLLG